MRAAVADLCVALCLTAQGQYALMPRVRWAVTLCATCGWAFFATEFYYGAPP